MSGVVFEVKYIKYTLFTRTLLSSLKPLNRKAPPCSGHPLGGLCASFAFFAFQSFFLPQKEPPTGNDAAFRIPAC